LNYNTALLNLTTDTESLVFTATSDTVILGFQVVNKHATDNVEFDSYIRRSAVDAYLSKGFIVGATESRNPIDAKAKIIMIDGDSLYAKINTGVSADVLVSYATMGGSGSGGTLPISEGDSGKVMVVKNTEDGYILATVQDVFLTLSPEDVGKIVVVNETADGYVVEDLVFPQELPDISPEKEGYFLQVVDGAATWQDTSIELPVASSSVLGGIKVGSGLSITEGFLSADVQSIPEATTTTLGGVIVGSGIGVTGGVISVTPYTLPAASISTRGGIRLGSNLQIRSGTTDMADVVVPTASAGTLGGVKVGAGLSISEGVLSITSDSTGVPVGAVTAFTGASPPSGWLICNGSAVSRTTYAALFGVIGAIYGAGDGSTTFNLPDLRGEFIRGLDSGRGVDTGRLLGSAQASANLSHSHTSTAHSHTVTINESSSTVTAGSGGTSAAAAASSQTKTTETSTVAINSSGGTEARPRNIAMNYIIKV